MKLIHTPDGQSIVKLDDIDFEIPELLMLRPAIKNYIEDLRADEKYYHDRAEKWEQILKTLDQIVEADHKTVWTFVKKPVDSSKTAETLTSNIEDVRSSKHPEPPVAQKEPETRSQDGALAGLCCPYCKSENIAKFGIRHNQSGDNQLYECKGCGQHFSEKNYQKANFENIKQLHAEGLKPREIAEKTGIKLATVYYHLRKLKGAEPADAQVDKSEPINQDAVSALQNLGFNKKDATAAVNEAQVESESIDTTDIVKSALQQIAQKSELIAEEKPKPELKMFIEDNGFDYRAHHPKLVGNSEVYDSGNGKLVIRSTRFKDEIVLTTKEAIDRLLTYEEKDFEWCIKSVRQAKRHVLREYIKNFRKSQLPLWHKDGAEAT